MDWCYRHTRHSAEGSLRDGETYCCPDETRVRGGNHRVRHGKTSLLRGNECVRDGNECFHEGDNGVRLDEGSVRGAQSSVRGGNDFFRLSKNHFVSNKIISVTEIIVDGGEAGMLLIHRDLPANGDNYFRHGK